MELHEGERAWVKYRGYQLWHERLLLRAADAPGSFVVCTPDFDVYLESLGPTILMLWMFVEFGVDSFPMDLPTRCPGYEGDVVKRGNEADLLLNELPELDARAPPERDHRALGLAAPLGVAPVAAPPPGRWRLLERFGESTVGDLHVPGAGAQVLEGRGVEAVNGRVVSFALTVNDEDKRGFCERLGLHQPGVAEPGVDARVLPVFYRSGDGRRERTWENVCNTVNGVDLDDFAITGPRTASWCIRFLQRQQQHPDDYHQSWRHRHKLNLTDWGVVQHQVALRTVALAGCSDQLDLTNLAAVEHLLREAQMVEYHYKNLERDVDVKGKGKQGLPNEEMDLFLGAGKSSHDAMVCPELMDHVAKAMERDALILKQSRKAREERALARK
mmetsp:Transcript_26387/g.57288  ORF Transcript_26387/g.57288 Transcript_26387/m.57288 type:complete len:387 (+) Transcript_26387:759-1919(+)